MESAQSEHMLWAMLSKLIVQSFILNFKVSNFFKYQFKYQFNKFKYEIENKLVNEGVGELAEALKFNTTLASLNLIGLMMNKQLKAKQQQQ